MMSIVDDCVDPGPEFHLSESVNASLAILDDWLGLRPGQSPVFAHDLATEFGSIEEHGEGLPVDSPEALALREAALQCVARFYGVVDRDGLRRYLSRFARRGEGGS